MRRSSEQMSWCRLLTGPGRAAIAVVELVGPDAIGCLQRFFQAASSAAWCEGQIRYGMWGPAQLGPAQLGPAQLGPAQLGPAQLGPGQLDSRQLDDHEGKPDHEGQSTAQGGSIAAETESSQASVAESVVVVCLALDRFEVHCHGGSAAVDRILAEIISAGIECRSGFELFNGVSEQYGDHRLIREASETLLCCTTALTAGYVMTQVRGELERWRREAIQSLTDGDEMPASSTAEGSSLPQSARSKQAESKQAEQIAIQAREIALRGEFGLRLGRTLDVVLAGPPNVGKSTLINAMVGYERSITMDMPGTTRDVLDVQTVYRGWPLRLRDTAGLHQSDDDIEQQGIQRAMRAISQADVIVRVFEPGSEDCDGSSASDAFPGTGCGNTSVESQSQPEGDQSQPKGELFGGRNHQPRVIKVMNKADKAAGTDTADGDRHLIRTIATTGEGVPDLLDTIVSTITAQSPPVDVPIPLNQSQIDWLLRVSECDFRSGSEAMLAILDEYA